MHLWSHEVLSPKELIHGQIDWTADHSTFIHHLSFAGDEHHRDEIGVLPFLPELEQCQGDYVQYPFVVQEQGTKLGIPIFCWVPVLDAAYGVFKDAVKSSLSPLASSSTETAAVGSGVSVDWWQDPGTDSVTQSHADTQAHTCTGVVLVSFDFVTKYMRLTIVFLFFFLFGDRKAQESDRVECVFDDLLSRLIHGRQCQVKIAHTYSLFLLVLLQEVCVCLCACVVWL